METKIKVTDSCGGSTGSEIHPGSGSSLSTLLLPLGLSGLEKVPAGQSFCDGSLLRSATLTSVSLHNLLLLWVCALETNCTFHVPLSLRGGISGMTACSCWRNMFACASFKGSSKGKKLKWGKRKIKFPFPQQDLNILSSILQHPLKSLCEEVLVMKLINISGIYSPILFWGSRHFDQGGKFCAMSLHLH